MTNAADARKRLRGIIEEGECVFPASVYDPISARIAEDIGFEMGMLGGSVASLAVLGAPDEILLTLSEFADQVRRITRASPLPLFCDADHGYGNALNVKRSVEELEAAGVTGLSIEDTQLPRQFGQSAGAVLLSVEEGAGKVKAAVAARQDKGLIIAGRTNANATDMDDVIERLQAYEAAGADMLFVVGIKTDEQLARVNAATSCPLFMGGLPVQMMDRKILAKMRVRIALQGHQPFAAAALAIHTTLKALRDGTLPSDLDGIADSQMMNTLMRRDQHNSDEQKFLS